MLGRTLRQRRSTARRADRAQHVSRRGGRQPGSSRRQPEGLRAAGHQNSLRLLERNRAVAEQADAGHYLVVGEATNHCASVVGQAIWNA